MILRLMREFWRRLGKLVIDNEKILLAILSVIIVLSGTVWYRQFLANRGEGPTIGGSFVEGIVGSEKDIALIAGKLTKSGLFRINEKGELTNLLVESWESNDEQSEFQFRLKTGINPEEIKTVLEAEPELIGSSEINVKANVIRIALLSPNPSLPLLLTRPLFDFGPYKMSKSNNKTAIFTRNTREHAAPAYINKVIIHNFDSAAELNESLQHERLDAAEVVEGVQTPDNYSYNAVGLNKYYAILFNINKTPFRDLKTRRALIDESGAAGVTFSLVVADQDPQKSLAEEIAERWRSQGATVTIVPKPKNEVLEKIGPSRDFQAILIGLDYGLDLDPYYLWHSSQLRPPGNNLTGLKSQKADELLETIRLTFTIDERKKQIERLHQLVNEEGAGLIVRQETIGYVVSNKIRFVVPWLAATPTDRFQATPLWSVK